MSSGYWLLLSSHRERKPEAAQFSTVATPPSRPFFMDQRSVEFAQNKNALLRPSSSEQFHFIAPMNSHDPFLSCSRGWPLRWHKRNCLGRICSTVLSVCLHSVLRCLGSGHFSDMAESALQEQESAGHSAGTKLFVSVPV